MNMEAIQSAASEALLNVVLAVIALAGAYAVYYIRLGASKLKAQTARIADEAGRKALEDAISDVERLATLSVGATEQTTAKALREAVKSGNASREELAAQLDRRQEEYRALTVALEALKNAGSTDPAAVNEALWDTTYTGVSGDIAFEPTNGDAIRDVAYVKVANTETGAWDFVTVQKAG